MTSNIMSVKENMWTVVRFPKAADLRDFSLGLARSLHGDLKWCGVHSQRTCCGEGSRPHRA